ncbi:MAG: polyribonucleotide nucleotidyltransferase [Candidatus Omnitrophica bacterium]|nr:polyribonucleotide nucleotidyltransferase [Candidatus Omnitrophota bacterium]
MEKIEIKLGSQTISVETGKLAKQADGAVTVQLGGTIVLVTAVASAKARDAADFFPLTVEYQERTYAAGKIPGGFFKREGKPSEKEVLTSRLIDRPIRPLFPDNMLNEVQIMAMVLSSDSANDSDVLAVLGASAALIISDIPFDGPIACVRVGRIGGKYCINPTFEELETSDMDLVVTAARTGKILMIESDSNELSEDEVIGGFEFARPHLEQMIKAQEEFARKVGRKKRDDITYREIPEELLNKLSDETSKRINDSILLPLKGQREEAFNTLCNEMIEKYVTDETGYSAGLIATVLSRIEQSIVRDYILHTGKRVDGRTLDQIRPIECATGLLPRTHGSGLFTRGQTQALSVTTLGTSDDEQMIDALEGETQKHFMLHYNFPPFSVGEVKPVRGPGRREIGHGALAEKALKKVMPSKEEFPYTVRVVSDILESNGSSSMATVCAGTLSLMDAGVPIKAPVAGIAIGLINEGDRNIILTDIAGVEDHYGDMDFKVAGTHKGITAIQLDTKIAGIDMATVKNTLQKARDARFRILDIMNKVIAKPKDAISEFAPRIYLFKIHPDKIKDVIGPGGKIIKKIIQDTGVTINIQDDGSVEVASVDSENAQKAIDIIKGLTASAEVGKIYKGTITRLMNFGAFCEILPGKEGLIHVSELANKFVKNVADEVKVGDEVVVKVIEIDEQGRVNLSRKQAASPAPEAK